MKLIHFSRYCYCSQDLCNGNQDDDEEEVPMQLKYSNGNETLTVNSGAKLEMTTFAAATIISIVKLVLS